MPLRKDDGTLNYIDLSAPALGDMIKTLTTKLTTMDQRLYPLPFVENVTREKTETQNETAPSGNIYKVQQGLRQNSMEFWASSASLSFMRELDTFGCTELGYFSVDILGTIEGWLDDAEPTKFYPIPVMKDTFDQMYMYATDTTVQKIKLKFNNRRDFDETKIYYLTANDLGYPATDLKGMIPATMVASLPTTTGVTITVTENSNSALGGVPIVGLGLANFEVINNTDNTTVGITGVSEISDGVYTLTYTDVTGTNTFSANIVGTGYDAPAVEYTDPT